MVKQDLTLTDLSHSARRLTHSESSIEARQDNGAVKQVLLLCMTVCLFVYGVRSIKLIFKFQLWTGPEKPEAEGRKTEKEKVKRKRRINQRMSWRGFFFSCWCCIYYVTQSTENAKVLRNKGYSFSSLEHWHYVTLFS